MYRLPKGAPHLAKGGAALYESLIGANFADLHSLSLSLFSSVNITQTETRDTLHHSHNIDPIAGETTGTNAGITMTRAAPACIRTVKASHSSSCARGSTDSRSLGEYENENETRAHLICASVLERR